MGVRVRIIATIDIINIIIIIVVVILIIILIIIIHISGQYVGNALKSKVLL